ncbi:MAG: hypothetical protein M5U26_23385 [Planctomycetota bacterium]|nr:hypothetical protein [Planctomycetota bacterium]
MFDYRDFFPRQVKAPGVFSPGRWQPFEKAVQEANRWIESQGVEVINVETVLLPNIYDADEGGSEDASLRTSGKTQTDWYQVVRVWFRS